MGYRIFGFRTSYPVKTKIPSHLVEELRAGGELPVVFLLLSQGHVLEARLSRRSGGGVGDLVFQIIVEEGRLVGFLTRAGLVNYKDIIIFMKKTLLLCNLGQNP